jgi:hypothetical protein
MSVKGKRLDGQLKGWGSELGSYVLLESDLMAWVGGLCTFPPNEATGNERSFKEERHLGYLQEWSLGQSSSCTQ